MQFAASSWLQFNCNGARMALAVIGSYERPRVVTIALSLIAADFVLSIVQSFHNRDITSSRLIAVVIIASLFSAWLFGLYRRLNWLRWVTIIMAISGLFLFPRAIERLDDGGTLAFQILKYALFDAGAILLCLPAARGWFIHKPNS